MKKYNILAIFALFFLLTSFKNDNKNDNKNIATIQVNVSNVQHHEGNIKAVLFDRNNFLTPQFVKCIEIPMSANNKNDAQMIFKDIPTGEYAIAIYHDLNSNDNFDRNWIGYPNEPFAISNNLKPYHLLLPNFDSAKVVVNNNEDKVLNIYLLNNELKYSNAFMSASLFKLPVSSHYSFFMLTNTVIFVP